MKKSGEYRTFRTMKGDVYQSFFSLEGRVAVVTGGAGELGGALAESLASAGVKVAILGRDAGRLEQRANTLQEIGEGFGMVADVLNRDQLLAARENILSRWGKIDILINAAGGNRPGAVVGPEDDLFALSFEDLEAVGRLNLMGTILPCLIFGETMARQSGGSLINISSMAANRAITRVAGYTAAKAGVEGITRWLAVEMARRYDGKIRVNAIAPGFFIADQNRRLLLQDDGSLTERGQAVIRQTPMGRFGRSEEICGAVHWLCSDSAGFVTGIVVPIDGGFSAFSGV